MAWEVDQAGEGKHKCLYCLEDHGLEIIAHYQDDMGDWLCDVHFNELLTIK